LAARIVAISAAQGDSHAADGPSNPRPRPQFLGVAQFRCWS
jgi:hypothetical protein